MNLFSILEEAGKRRPEDTAVVHGDRSFRYADLHAASESLAIKLRQAGVQAGDKVGVMNPSSLEYLISFFAVVRLGAIVISISPALKATEIADLAEEMGLDAFCYSARLKALVPEGRGGGLTEVRAFAGGTPLTIQLAANRNTPHWEREQLLGMKVAWIRFSSGTTAKAKGIILSHATLLERMNLREEGFFCSAGDSILYLGSMGGRIPSPGFFSLGVKIVIADVIEMEGLAALVRQYGVTEIYGSPMVYRALLNEPGITAEDFRGVRYFMSTASSLSSSIAEAFRAKFGREIVQRYGSGECGGVMTNFNEDASKRGSVGKPKPSMEVKLVSGKSYSSEGEAMGELFVRGPGMFDAYYKPWRLRDEVLEDGWFRTGDIAQRDADGYYWIVGRVKDVINVGGVKVFPSEIEATLLKHPGVEEAVVYGAPEPRFGEAPHAKVKLRSGAACRQRELLRYVNERLSVFKALRGVEFVEEIPKTVTGKPRRVG